MQRKIIQIDAEKCDGCGLCASACAEGAIQIRDGKARLVSDVYCDGLGACLGECPRGAIAVIQREAESFDEEAAKRHVAGLGAPPPQMPGPAADSALSHWPVQLRLVPPNAPFFQNADLLLVADCVPFALADFHQRFLRGRPVVVSCPKLDDRQSAVDKLTALLTLSSVRRLTVVHMEVPCCTGLVHIAQTALAASGKEIPLEDVTISLRGKELDARSRPPANQLLPAFSPCSGGCPSA
jgi:Pyruvate/2-oxoacid:ferredoxin oxidoreductase delta subunit